MRWKAGYIAGAAWLAAITRASGVELRVLVHEADGAPVAEAIVTLETQDRPYASARRSHIVDQRSEEFLPLVTLMRPGDSLRFENSDRTLHHVYSFSPMNRFEFVVRMGETSRAIEYDTVGVAAIGCNVHDNMITYAVVTDAPFAAKTDAMGLVVIENAPEGPAVLSAWHPRARAKGKTATQEIYVETKDTLFEITLPLAVTKKFRGAEPY